MLRKLINRIIYPHSYSSNSYVNYLRKHGALIGNNTRFVSPKNCRELIISRLAIIVVLFHQVLLLMIILGMF